MLIQPCIKTMRVCTYVMDPALKGSPSGPFPVDPLARSWMVGAPEGKTQQFILDLVMHQCSTWSLMRS